MTFEGKISPFRTLVLVLVMLVELKDVIILFTAHKSTVHRVLVCLGLLMDLVLLYRCISLFSLEPGVLLLCLMTVIDILANLLVTLKTVTHVGKSLTWCSFASGVALIIYIVVHAFAGLALS